MANILWFERLPKSLVYVITFLVLICKLYKDRKRICHQHFVLCSIFFLYCLMAVLIWENSSKSNLFFTFLWGTDLFLFAASLFLLNAEEKELLLTAISKCLMLIIAVSVPAWLLFVVGYDLPHSDVIFHENGFHQYYDYYFFRLSAKSGDVFNMILPRFSSFFLEPGQLATPCVFVFFLNGARFCWKNFPFILAILLSFSLISYVLLAVSLIVRRVLVNRKSILLQLFLAIVMIGGTYVYFTQFVDEENPVNKFIFSRLEYDKEKGISGNNRTSDYFERKYEKFYDSSDMYLGMSDKLEKSDWTYNCSGYKKFIVRHGIIGFMLFVLFVVLIFVYNRSLASFFYLMILLMAFFVRDLLQAPLWLSLALLGLSLLGDQKSFRKTLF